MEISTFFKSEEDIIEKLLKKKKQMDYKLNVPSNKIIIAGRKGNIKILSNNMTKIKVNILFENEHKNNRIPCIFWLFCKCSKPKKYCNYNSFSPETILNNYQFTYFEYLVKNMMNFNPSEFYSINSCLCGYTNIYSVLVFQDMYFEKYNKKWNPKEWPFHSRWIKPMTVYINYNLVFNKKCPCHFCAQKQYKGNIKQKDDLLKKSCKSISEIFDYLKNDKNSKFCHIDENIIYYILEFLPLCKNECGWYETLLHINQRNCYKPLRKYFSLLS